MKFSTAIIISFLFITICDALLYLSWVGLGSSLSYYIMMPLKYISLSILIFISLKKKWKDLIPKNVLLLFILLLTWNLITIVHGMIKCQDYYDWKFLMETSFFFLLIPFAMVIGIYHLYTQKLFSVTLKYLFLLGFAIISFSFGVKDALYSQLMLPVSVFILISPYLKPKWRILIFIVAVTSILIVPSFRTNIVRIVAALLLVIIYYLRHFMKIRWLKIIHILLFIAPAILLYLAITTQFNIFSFQNKDEKYNITNDRGETRNLFEDNRTFLYAEVITSLLKNNNLVFGEGAVGKYKSDRYDFGDNRGRYMSEVGFLNTLLFSGILGVVLYFCFIFTVSFYALYRSNNWLSKMIGLFIAFRWILFFIEEITLFNLNFFFYWILLGLVSTNEFRKMNDLEVKSFFQEI